jgi:hypothetical protein
MSKMKKKMIAEELPVEVSTVLTELDQKGEREGQRIKCMNISR